MKRNFFTLLLMMFSVCTIAEESKAIINTTKFETILGSTRLIYSLNNQGAVLSIKNPQDYPILVQSKVVDPNKIESNRMIPDHHFIVTPPLFRLEGLRQTSIKVVKVGGDYPNDRESLRYLCVKGIPPKKDDVWSKDNAFKNNEPSININIANQTCIKLIIRPKLSIGYEVVAKELNWDIKDGFLYAKNNSPFYVQPAFIKINNHNVDVRKYIVPFSVTKFKVDYDIKGAYRINWAYIDDNGAVSENIFKELH